MKAIYILPLVLATACAHARTPAEYSADTESALATKAPDIKACYDKLLATTPTATGHVTVKFTVEPKTGRIVDPQLDTTQTSAPAAVSQCVLDAIPTAAISPGDRNRGEATFAWDFSAK